MITGVIAAVSEFERDLLIERTQAGLSRAKAQGRYLGRPAALSATEQAEALEMRSSGASLQTVATHFKVSRAAIQRLGRKAEAVHSTV